MFRAELAALFARTRTRVSLGVLALVPVLGAVALRLSSQPPTDAPPYWDRIQANGVFLPLAVLAAVAPILLPMTVAIVAGDAVAGEAELGTLRYVLAWPVARAKLLAVKYATALAYALAAAVLLAALGLALGAALFPVGAYTTTGHASVPLAAAVGRVGLVALVVAADMAGLAAIGLFLSTLTPSSLGAIAATVGVTIVSFVLNELPQFAALHPWLFTHYWLAIGDLIGISAGETGVWNGLVQQSAYAAGFLALSWLRFRRQDILT